MNIKDSEKLILLMLCDLYEKNNVESDIDHNFVRDAIYDKQTWAIPWRLSGIPFEQQDTPPHVKTVFDILDMWRVIEYSYGELSNEGKDTLAENIKPFSAPVFRGFDGNNETDLLVAAEFIINKLDRFEEFKGRDLNSHTHSVDGYLRMLGVFTPELRSNMGRPLSVEQLSSILLERIHPSNR
ncbi:YfbU family protein [Pectobacterium carotovorum]|uniref:YfbU family protein n=1 Tax=Pectobacterium carotovorum TaxID=554 RepID=UPI0038233051